MTQYSLSRREFLKVAAVGSTVTLIAACQPAGPAAQSGEAGGQAAAPTELRFIKLAMSDPVPVYFEDTVIPGFEEANSGLTVTVDM
ncbi:twin-arginine translocation signal domain-containing protein, partial [Candidatus Saccharibacteria bacterium]|nr:twin-arginine translocation signal domain-containing protein [Candidatus Saccharibacteria bacterium]